jgi:signal transduction histidine kinase
MNFRDLSIKGKLMAIIMATTSASLIVAAAFSMVDDVLTLRQEIKQDLSTLGHLIGANSTAALVFSDPRGAEETLSALRAKENIVAAAIYNKEAKVFAVYVRDPPSKDFAPPPPSSPQFRFERDRLILFDKVALEGETIGTVYLQSDLKGMYARLKRDMVIVLMMILLAVLVAFVLSTFLQKVISSPIERLAATARRVSVERDYRIRVEPHGKDELGLLIDGFNEMLMQIQERDASLRKARDELEERVQERTQELRKEIQERARAEERLKRTVEELERSNRELEQFAYVASHDLQEPLRKIIAFGDRLKKAGQARLDELSQDYLERMQSAASRMKQLIEDILALSRVTTRGRPFEEVSLDAVVREVLTDLETHIDQTGGKVEVGRLPTVKGDGFQMRQLFQNLISNALKFSRREEPPVIRIHSRPPKDGFVEITVEDNGIGFDEKYLDRIFKPFQRLHTQHEFPGTGMGLAICEKIVLRHGGRISASSRPGRGAKFMIALPASGVDNREKE